MVKAKILKSTKKAPATKANASKAAAHVMTLRKPVTQSRVGNTAAEFIAMGFAINPKAKKGQDKEQWDLAKIVCEWLNKDDELVGYFVKYKGFEKLGE